MYAEKWKYLGDFSHNNSVPTVVLDQNISIRALAQTLYSDGFRVIRAIVSCSIPDDEVRVVADRHNGLVLTVDRGFESHPSSLILPPWYGLKARSVPRIVDTVDYIFGRAGEPPEIYFRRIAPNGYNDYVVQREAEYWQRVETLRMRFARTP